MIHGGFRLNQPSALEIPARRRARPSGSSPGKNHGGETQILTLSVAARKVTWTDLGPYLKRTPGSWFLRLPGTEPPSVVAALALMFLEPPRTSPENHDAEVEAAVDGDPTEEGFMMRRGLRPSPVGSALPLSAVLPPAGGCTNPDRTIDIVCFASIWSQQPRIFNGWPGRDCQESSTPPSFLGFFVQFKKAKKNWSHSVKYYWIFNPHGFLFLSLYFELIYIFS